MQIGMFDGGQKKRITKPILLIELFAGNSIVVDVLTATFGQMI